MTYHTFYLKWQDSLSRKKAKTRQGEHLMMFLAKHWKKEYRRVCSRTRYSTPNIDCYNNDDYIPNTLKHLKQVWSNKKKRNE